MNDKSLLAVIDVLCDTVLEDPRAAHHLKNPHMRLFSNEKCVSREAIRFHLKNIFSKTGVKRQGRCHGMQHDTGPLCLGTGMSHFFPFSPAYHYKPHLLINLPPVAIIPGSGKQGPDRENSPRDLVYTAFNARLVGRRATAGRVRAGGQVGAQIVVADRWQEISRVPHLPGR